jgi:hypothetical protein
MDLQIWAKWFAEIAVGVASTGSLIVAIFTIRGERKKSGAETYCKLEEKFYHTDLMRGLRRAAATELLTDNVEYFPAFDDLGDFFYFIGILVRLGALDIEMAHSSYYRRATAFWHIGEKRKAVHEARAGEPSRWDEFAYLVRTLENLQEKMDKATNRPNQNGRLTDEQIITLLEHERNLPSIERWAALPSVSKSAAP